MTGWIVLGVYVGGFLFTYRHAYLTITHSDEQRSSYQTLDSEDRAMNAIMAMMGALMWPLTLAGFALWRFATPRTAGERKAELDERERRVTELERELGIEKGRP
jgi:lysylphosphatidylglycerol synthetase-like protein (DUF2156 family)